MTHRRLYWLWAAAMPIASAAAMAQFGCPKDETMPIASQTATITVRSSAFEGGKAIPARFTGEGADVSPPLEWSSLPDGVKELALICDDPDAPRKEPWVHWVLAKIPAGTLSLAEGASSAKARKSPAGMVDGQNDFGSTGYQGPMPPPGKPHRYFFRVYALDAPLDIKGKLDKPALLTAMNGHILATGELVGSYQRH